MTHRQQQKQKQTTKIQKIMKKMLYVAAAFAALSLAACGNGKTDANAADSTATDSAAAVEAAPEAAVEAATTVDTNVAAAEQEVSPTRPPKPSIAINNAAEKVQKASKDVKAVKDAAENLKNAAESFGK